MCYGLNSSTETYTIRDVTLPLKYTDIGTAACLQSDHSIAAQGLVTCGCGLLNTTTLRFVHDRSYNCWTNYAVIGY